MSNKKRYKSIFGAKGLITAPNYLAELIIQKRADLKGIKIPPRIWGPQYKKDIRYKYWHNAYFSELNHAHALCKDFDATLLITAFNDFECKPILTLKNAKLTRIANQLKQKKELAESIKEKNVLNVVSADTTPRKKQGKKNKLGKLK